MDISVINQIAGLGVMPGRFVTQMAPVHRSVPQKPVTGVVGLEHSFALLTVFWRCGGITLN